MVWRIVMTVTSLWIGKVVDFVHNRRKWTPTPGNCAELLVTEPDSEDLYRSDRATWTFALLLRWHLRHRGTRPDGNRQVWQIEEFADELKTEPRNVENWLNKGTLPQRGTFDQIVPKLFGASPCSEQERQLRAELVERYDRQYVRQNRAAAPPSAPAFVPPPDMPPSTLHFVGRALELEKIHVSLKREMREAPTGKPNRLVLSGMGGVGKSSLAAAYVRSFGLQYEGVWWCNAESPQALRTSLSRLHRALAPEAPERPEIAELANAALRLVAEAEHSRPWLLVYDNAPSPDVIRELLPPDDVPLLITSRSPFWSNWARPVSVEALPLAHALELLRCRAPTINHDGNEVLAERLGRLPLALDHAAAFCEQSGLSFAEYGSKVGKLVAVRPHDSAYPMSVAATFEIAITDAERQFPEAGVLMDFLAQCASERIPMPLVEAAVGDEAKRHQAIALLAALSLIRHDPFPDRSPAITLHRLVQRVAWLRSVEMGTAESVQKRLFGRLTELYPDPDLIFSDNACWQVCDRLTPHIFAWLARPETEGPSREKLADFIAGAGPTLTRAPRLGRLRHRVSKLLGLTKPEDLLWPNLMQLAGHYLHARTSYEDAAEVWRGVVKLWERLLGPFHPITASAATNLGLVLGNLGDFSGAEACHQRALEIHRKTVGRDHIDTADTLDHLGNMARRQGHLSQARAYYDRALRIRRQCLGEAHLDIATSLNYLSLIAYDHGDLSTARSLIEQAISIREHALGPDHFETTMLLGGLGAHCHEQGDFARAEALHQRVLAATEARLKIDHPNVATDLNNLARSIQAQGHYDRARPLFERALAMRERIFGPDHYLTGESLHNLGGLRNDEGNFIEARRLFERALEVREKSLGLDHPDVAYTLYVLADILCQQADYSKARALHERALTIREKAFGPTHPSVAASLVGLVRVLSDQGDYASARPVAERALSASARVYGDHDDHTAACTAHLARLLYHEGMLDEARAMFEQALDSFEKALGRNHIYTVTARGDLAKIIGEQGDFEAARTLYEDALLSLSETKGQDHLHIAALLNNYGELLRAHRKFSEADIHFERALTITEEALGPGHPDANRVRCNLARLFFDQGRLMEALPLAQTSLDNFQDALGDSHPQTVISAQVLVRIFDELGRTEESVRLRGRYHLDS